LLTIGGVSDTFSSTTLTDTVPDAFSFTDQVDVATSTLITSNTVTITGLGASSPVSITGGKYSINGGTYTSVAGFINNNDSITLQITSSATELTATNVTLSIGGVNDVFTVTTKADGPGCSSDHRSDRGSERRSDHGSNHASDKGLNNSSNCGSNHGSDRD